MVTRPFLLTHVARALLRYQVGAEDFIRGMNDPLRGVGAVIEAFVEREVSEKWKQKETGEPYLTKEQHLRLLADVAEEMFRSQRDRLDIDLIETLTTLLLDEWEIEAVRRQQVLDMVRMHVLLARPADGDEASRAFDHPEFRDWFTAYALKDHLVRLVADGPNSGIASFLGTAQMSDATARYACALLDRTEPTVRIRLQRLCELAAAEWRPTYLQINVGTLIPFLIDGVEHAERFEVDASVVYTSLVFEATLLSNVIFTGGAFVNASFYGVVWDDVTFADCDLGEIKISESALYRNVAFRNCRIEGLRLILSDGEEVREYAPERIASALGRVGSKSVSTLTPQSLRKSCRCSLRLLRQGAS